MQGSQDPSKDTGATSASQESPVMDYTVKVFSGKKFILREDPDGSNFYIMTTKDQATQEIMTYQNPQQPSEFIISIKPSDMDCDEHKPSVRAVLLIPPAYDGRYHYIDIQQLQIEVRFPNITNLINSIPNYKPYPKRISNSINPFGKITPEPLVPRTASNIGGTTPPATREFRILTRDPLMTPDKAQETKVPTRPRKSNVGDMRCSLDEEYDTGSPRPNQKRRRASKALPSRKAATLGGPGGPAGSEERKSDLED